MHINLNLHRLRLYWNLLQPLRAQHLEFKKNILCLRVVQMSRAAKAQTVAFSSDSVASQHAQLGSCHWHIATLLPGPDTVSSW